MADVVSNFLEWFMPGVGSIPEPIQVFVGVIFIGLFFGMLLHIFKR